MIKKSIYNFFSLFCENELMALKEHCNKLEKESEENFFVTCHQKSVEIELQKFQEIVI